MGITPDLALPPVPKPGRNCIENEFEAPKHPLKVVNGGPLQPPTAPYGAPQPPELPMAPHRALQPPAAPCGLPTAPDGPIRPSTAVHGPLRPVLRGLYRCLSTILDISLNPPEPPAELLLNQVVD